MRTFRDDLERRNREEVLRTASELLDFHLETIRTQPRYSPIAVAVEFALIRQRIAGGRGESVSLAELADLVGRTKREAARGVAELREQGRWSVSPGAPGRGGRRNRYTPTPGEGQPRQNLTAP